MLDAQSLQAPTGSSASMADPLSVINARGSPRFIKACFKPWTRTLGGFSQVQLQMAAEP